MASIELIASELVCNVVQHAAAATAAGTVEIAVIAGVLHLGITDGSTHMPVAGVVRVHAAPDCDTHGRGLDIVEAVLDEYGGWIDVDRHRDGTKTIWARLPLPRGVESGGIPSRQATAGAAACRP
ncbi:ATP-binding protein (plasmid) [Streptomycetaceae bacterium NBC_01309]